LFKKELLKEVAEILNNLKQETSFIFSATSNLIPMWFSVIPDSIIPKTISILIPF